VDTTLLQDYHWIIVPVQNIDGYSYSRINSNTRLWRKNREPNTGSTCIGTDLNRNYEYGWGGSGASTYPCDETYRGAGAISAPETRAETTFLTNYVGRKGAYVDIHSYGGYFLSSYGNVYTYPPDFSVMDSYMTNSVNAIRAVNGRTYRKGSTANLLYLASGGSNDFTYGSLGVIPSFTIECAGTSFIASVNDIVPIGSLSGLVSKI